MSKMFYVPQITSAGALVRQGYFRAESESAAREKAREIFGVPLDELGPARELTETYCAAMQIEETKAA